MSALFPNTTQTPDIIFDQWMCYLSGAETKVVMAIVRKTYGFRKAWDRISLTQLEELTGLDRKTVITVTGQLKGVGIIRVAEGKRGTGKREDACNAYRLEMANADAILSNLEAREAAWQTRIQGKKATRGIIPLVEKNPYPTSGIIPPPLGELFPPQQEDLSSLPSSSTGREEKKDPPSPPASGMTPSHLNGQKAALSSVEKPKPKLFAPPTRDMVLAYMTELGIPGETDGYFDHFTGNGWRTNQGKVSDWQATARTWKRNALKWAKDKTHGHSYTPGGYNKLGTFGLAPAPGSHLPDGTGKTAVAGCDAAGTADHSAATPKGFVIPEGYTGPLPI